MVATSSALQQAHAAGGAGAGKMGIACALEHLQATSVINAPRSIMGLIVRHFVTWHQLAMATDGVGMMDGAHVLKVSQARHATSARRGGLDTDATSSAMPIRPVTVTGIACRTDRASALRGSLARIAASVRRSFTARPARICAMSRRRATAMGDAGATGLVSAWMGSPGRPVISACRAW